MDSLSYVENIKIVINLNFCDDWIIQTVWISKTATSFFQVWLWRPWFIIWGHSIDMTAQIFCWGIICLDIVKMSSRSDVDLRNISQILHPNPLLFTCGETLVPVIWTEPGSPNLVQLATNPCRTLMCSPPVNLCLYSTTSYAMLNRVVLYIRSKQLHANDVPHRFMYNATPYIDRFQQAISKNVSNKV